MKPFCTGDRGDVELFGTLLEGELPNDLINPFYFPEPVAPLLAARNLQVTVEFKEVLERIRLAQSGSDFLLIEGAGGLLSPLGEGYTAADLIQSLHCPVIVVARNRLGVINHVLLTVNMLALLGISHIKVVLMGCRDPDVSAPTNGWMLSELLGFGEVLSLPFFGEKADKVKAVKRNAKKSEKVLARTANFDTFSTAFDKPDELSLAVSSTQQSRASKSTCTDERTSWNVRGFEGGSKSRQKKLLTV